MDHAFSPEHQNNLYMKTIKLDRPESDGTFVVIAALAMGCSGGSAGIMIIPELLPQQMFTSRLPMRMIATRGVNMAQDVTGNGGR